MLVGVAAMKDYVARANIDHYLALLNDDDGISADQRTVIGRLLIEEEDKLSRAQEQLDFALMRTASCRARTARLRKLRDSFIVGSAARADADKTLANFEVLLGMMDEACLRLRAETQASRL
jgi:hypothetical protein